MSDCSESPIVFRCGTDELVGIVHHGAEAVMGVSVVGLLIVVGGPQYRVGSHRQFVSMARALAAAGFAVMRFDYRGMGDSDGAVRNFEATGQDIHAAIDAFAGAVPQLRAVVLWGLCDGASAILMEGCRHSRVRGLVLVNPWVRTEVGEAQAFVKHYYGRRLLQLSFWTKVFSGQVNPVRAARDFLATYLRTNAPASRPQCRGAGSFIDRMHDGWVAFTGPVLLLISGKDLTAKEFMDFSAASPAWQKLLGRPDVRTVELKEADHTFSQRAALAEATDHCRGMLTKMASDMRSGT